MKNSIIRRFTVLTLMLCIVSSAMYIPVSAYSEMEYPATYESGNEPEKLDLAAHGVDVAALRSYLADALKSCPDSVDVSAFNIQVSDSTAFAKFFWEEIPECFHVKTLGWYSSDIITKIVAEYNYTETEYRSMLGECEAKAAVLLDGIKDNDSLSDAEKALLLHDRLAVNCSYDYKFSELSYKMYGALVRGLAVCDGYSYAYAYLLNAVGIENLHCTSGSLNHAWNLVKINGNYYHVDVTWDDPSVNSYADKSFEGSVYHDNFLLSNEGITNAKHTATDFYDPAYDTTYDNYFWKCSTTEFQLIGDQIYYMDNDTEELKRLNSDRVSGTALCSVEDMWPAGANSYWVGNFSKLSSSGSFLFYSTSDTVYEYSTVKNETKEIFSPELTGIERIYGFTYDNGYLVCDINDNPGKTYDQLRQVRQAYTPKEPGTLEFSGVTVTLKNNLSINFKADASLFTDFGYEDPYAMFEFNGKETKVSSYTVSNGKYAFTFKNISPDMMNDEITVTLYATKNGSLCSSDAITYSIASYCYDLLDQTADADLITLLVDLLNYGAMSQIYTGHNVTELVNANLTNDQRLCASTLDPASLQRVTNTNYNNETAAREASWKSAGLNLNDSVTMRFSFTANDVDEVKVVVRDGADNVLAEISSDEITESNGRYTAHFRGLNANEMRKTVYVTVFRGNEQVSHTLRYSIESYAAYYANNGADANLQNLVLAMMKYGISAEAYTP